MFRIVALFFILLWFLSACSKKEETDPGIPCGNAMFSFHHTLDGNVLQKNQLIYTNAAGNHYLVTDLIYFISEVTFYHHNGSSVLIHEWKDIFYIDEAVDTTTVIRFYDPLPLGDYDSVSFTFGIPAEKNHSLMFVNPPEVFMAWPEILGGGYHYLMMNGKWEDPAGILQPFNLHLGIGQLYRGTTFNTDSIYAYVHNDFRVSLKSSAFMLRAGETAVFDIVMDAGSWFQTPTVFDWNVFGGAIMQNQEAMQIVRDNGYDVFSLATPVRKRIIQQSIR